MTSKGKKNTNAGKKGKTKTQSPEKKTLTEAPVAAGVDKEKMAAFFSAAEEQSAAPQEDSPAAETQAVEAPAAEVVAEAVAAPPQEPAPPAGKSASGSGDNGSFSLVFLFIILGVIGVSWFYYVNSHTARIKATSATLKTAGVATAAPAIEQKIKDLEAQIACLQSRLAALEAKARKASAAVVPAPPQLKKVEIKPAPAAQDSSFKKAPVPFWRQESFRHPAGPGKSLINKSKPQPAPKPAAKPAPAVKSVKEVKKTAAPAPVVKDSSFDKAPVPFWRQEKFKSPASRAQAVLQSNADKAAAKDKKPAAKKANDSFSKAPKPFWEK